MLARALSKQKLLVAAEVQAEVQAEMQVQAAPVVVAPPPGTMVATEEEAVPSSLDLWIPGALDSSEEEDVKEDVDEDVEDCFLLRQMALRQYIEVRRQPASLCIRGPAHSSLSP